MLGVRINHITHPFPLLFTSLATSHRPYKLDFLCYRCLSLLIFILPSLLSTLHQAYFIQHLTPFSSKSPYQTPVTNVGSCALNILPLPLCQATSLNGFKKNIPFQKTFAESVHYTRLLVLVLVLMLYTGWQNRYRSLNVILPWKCIRKTMKNFEMSFKGVRIHVWELGRKTCMYLGMWALCHWFSYFMGKVDL